MAEPTVNIPIVCPECGQEAVAALAIASVAEALMLGKKIRLHSKCHDTWWNASQVEMEQFREYIGALSLTATLPLSDSDNPGLSTVQLPLTHECESVDRV